MIYTLDPSNEQVPLPGDSLIYTMFVDNDGTYKMRATMNGLPVKINGDNSGTMELQDFWTYLRSHTYSGSVEAVCDGTENPETAQSHQYNEFATEDVKQDEVKPSRHYVDLPQDREPQQGQVEVLRPDPEVSYDDTTEREVAMNPIRVQDMYVPQEY